MSKARTLAGVVSTGAVLADGTIDAAEIGNLTLPTGGDIVGTTATQTLTNKTIDIASNTLTGVQASLVSGANIKTVNSTSLLGSGDVAVQPTLVSGTNIKTVNSTSLLGSGDVAVQPTLVSGTNIKTVNGESVLGSGDIAIAGGLTFDFPYSESITAGDVLQLLSSGEVEKVKISAVSQTIPSGSAVTYGSSGSSSIAFDPNDINKFVVVYRDSSTGYGRARVGVIDVNTITLYTEYTFVSQTTNKLSVDFDPLIQGKFAISFFRIDGSSDAWSAIIGQVSGTALSFGSPVNILTNYTVSSSSLRYFPNESNRFVIACSIDSRGQYVIATVSGTTPSFGSVVTLSSGTTEQIGLAHSKLVSGKFFIAYNDGGLSWDVIVKMLTSTSGTSATNNSTYQIVMGSEAAAVNIACDPSVSDKFVVTYRDWANSSRLYANVGTYSSSAITAMSSGIQISTETCEASYVQFDPLGGGSLAIGGYIGSAFKVAGGVLSGTTLTMSSVPVTLGIAGNTENYQFAFTGVTPGKFVGAGSSQVIAGQAAASISNLSGAAVIGVAQESGTTGQTKKVALKGGVDSARTGLTPQSTYYVQSDGTVSTSATSPAVKLGRALSSTALLLVGEQ